MRMYVSHLVAAGATLLGSACGSQLDSGGPGGPDDAGAQACGSSTVADAPYTTVAELEALVVDRWIRCDGPPQLADEELGVELTEGRVIFPLRRASDGAFERVPPAPGVGPESWSALLDWRGRPRLVFMWASSPSKSRSSFVIEGPGFFDGGRQMFLPYAEVGATYVRFRP
jgi:hypothetical protein